MSTETSNAPDGTGGRSRRVTTPDEEATRQARDVPDGGPIFIAGPDRSGTTLMFALLASHPNISMVRRTNMWRWFDGRYGDLRDPSNLDRCLHDMAAYRRMRHLQPDVDRIRRDFLRGEPTYGRLFALFHEHNAERAGKRRWGDKSLHTEHYVDRVFAAFPDARVIHMVRDPRDRYASVKKRHGRTLSRVGAATGRWLDSTRAGRRNQDRYPDRYLMLRYEDLARDPEGTLRRLSAYIGEEYAPEMLTMHGARDHRDRGGNSSFGDVEPGAISTRAIGRYREVLGPSEVKFAQLLAGRDMAAMGYERAEVKLSPSAWLWFALWELPTNLVRMVGWMLLARIGRSRIRVPGWRLEDRGEAS